MSKIWNIGELIVRNLPWEDSISGKDFFNRTQIRWYIVLGGIRKIFRVCSNVSRLYRAVRFTSVVAQLPAWERERAHRVNGRREDNGVEMVKSVCVLSLTILLSSLYDFTNRSQAMAELLYAKVAERRNGIAICCTGMGRYFLFTFQIIFYRTRGYCSHTAKYTAYLLW